MDQRWREQNYIRASLEKQIGSELEVHSLPDASSDAFDYDNETYQQTANGQSVEGGRAYIPTG